jgi:hypothetical protein
MNLGAKLQEARGHRLAETGAAASDQNLSTGQEIILEHASIS